ncbi:MAG TPA: hypothetical protein VK137_08225, partial [Planctomycetaceae bacterium]|nr:hypothetical protein [Planctomycetaceae bacterium]
MLPVRVPVPVQPPTVKELFPAPPVSVACVNPLSDKFIPSVVCSPAFDSVKLTFLLATILSVVPPP